MGDAAGWRRTEGPKAGEWFLDAYYYSFCATGNDLIDELLSALAWAGKRYHNTDQWSNSTGENEDGPSSIDEIQAAANRAAAEIERLRADLVWSVRHQAALYHDTPVKHVCFWIDEGWRKSDEVECDGTSESICRAVREARDGVS